MADGQVWRCGRCGHLNETEATIIWDDDNARWFQVGAKYGGIEPKCHTCCANIYLHPEYMGQLYRLEPVRGDWEPRPADEAVADA